MALLPRTQLTTISNHFNRVLSVSVDWTVADLSICRQYSRDYRPPPNFQNWLAKSRPSHSPPAHSPRPLFIAYPVPLLRIRLRLCSLFRQLITHGFGYCRGTFRTHHTTTARSPWWGFDKGSLERWSHAKMLLGYVIRYCKYIRHWATENITGTAPTGRRKFTLAAFRLVKGERIITQ